MLLQINSLAVINSGRERRGAVCRPVNRAAKYNRVMQVVAAQEKNLFEINHLRLPAARGDFYAPPPRLGQPGLALQHFRLIPNLPAKRVRGAWRRA